MPQQDPPVTPTLAALPSLPSSPAAEESKILSASGGSRSGSPANFEVLDLAELTDNVSVASYGEAAGSNTSESSHMSSNLLRLETKGCLGCFERLPLPVKISLLVLFSAIGFIALSAFTIVISARQMHTSTTANVIVTHTTALARLVDTLQKERRAGRLMLFDSSTTLQIDYLKAIPTTENSITSMLGVIAGYQENYGSSYTDFVTKRSTLDTIRAKTTARTATINELLDSYNEVIRTVLNMLHNSNVALGYLYDISAISLFYEFNEATFTLNTVGSLMIRVPSLRESLIPMLYQARSVRSLAENMLVKSGPSAPVLHFKKVVLEAAVMKQYNSMLEQITVKAGNYSFNASQFDTAGFLTAQVIVRNDVFSADALAQATVGTNQSIGIIVAVIVIVLFFSGGAISNAILFSLSIIGPWKRLNALQESTISKFVPKGFLSLMGWKSISQAALGKYEEREITVLVVSIANYSDLALAYKETPGQLYDFINAFLAYVGPYIRNNGGYIDKFNGSHFVSIFQKDKKGIKAALEVQQSMANFNKMQTAFSVVVRSTFVSGKVAIGTIGENERMESTSLSGVMKMAMKLQKVAKRSNATILTTRESLAKLQNPKAIHHRYIGHVKLRSKLLGSNDLCEVLTFAEPLKIKTKDHFSKAVKYLQAGRFTEALSVFESIVQSNPNDALAIRYRDLTKRSIMENIKRLSELTVSQILHYPTLRTPLEHMCNQEHSAENLILWNQIQMYKDCQSPEERRSLATKICQDCLQLEGNQAVNLSAEQMAAVKQVVQNGSSTLSPLLFVELEALIEHVMMDTVRRLIQTQSFKLAFLQSALAFKPEQIDLL